MTTISADIDAPAYLRAPTGQEAASLLGLNTTIGGGSSVPAGTLSLPVVASAGWAAGPLWLLDGPSSEVAQVTGAADATHLTLAAPGTANAHAQASPRARRGLAGRWPRSFCGRARGSRTTASRERLRIARSSR